MADNSPPPSARVAELAVVQMNAVIKNASRLNEIVQASIEATPALSSEAVTKTISEKTGIEVPTLQAIFSALENLKTLKEDRDSAEGAIESVLSVFGKDKFPGIEDVKDKIRDAVDTYTDDNPVAISYKANKLSYLHEKLFVDAEIITDARPVYNTKGDLILEYVIGHSLLVTYHEDSGYATTHNHPRLHIGMDLDDIVALRAACDRAILKGLTLKTELGKKARVLGDDG